MAKDPVCGMEVDEKEAMATSVSMGVTNYFCDVGCMNSFAKDPEKYLGKE